MDTFESVIQGLEVKKVKVLTFFTCQKHPSPLSLLPFIIPSHPLQVSEMESQIDTFESEMEGLQVKKGKQRPPRLVHLEESIVRHKAHIYRLEMILRLLENDELGPDQVAEVKDFVEDYVERNQVRGRGRGRGGG